MRKMNCKILAAALLAIQIAVAAMPASALACENDLVEETTQEQVEMTAEITEEAAPAEPEVIAKETEETPAEKDSAKSNTENDTVKKETKTGTKRHKPIQGSQSEPLRRERAAGRQHLPFRTRVHHLSQRGLPLEIKGRPLFCAKMEAYCSFRGAE